MLISMGYKYVKKVGIKKDSEQSLDNLKVRNYRIKIGFY